MAVYYDITPQRLRRLGRKREDFIAQGGSRAVFVYDEGHVIKYDDTGSGQNRNEVQRWQTLKDLPIAKHMFAIVKWADDYSWVVQERAHASLDKHPRFEELRDEIREVAKQLNMWDAQDHNVGLREDGTWAFMDLGL